MSMTLVTSSKQANRNAVHLFYSVAGSRDPFPISDAQTQSAHDLEHADLIRPYKDSYILTPAGYALYTAPYQRCP